MHSASLKCRKEGITMGAKDSSKRLTEWWKNLRSELISNNCKLTMRKGSKITKIGSRRWRTTWLSWTERCRGLRILKKKWRMGTSGRARLLPRMTTVPACWWWKNSRRDSNQKGPQHQKNSIVSTNYSKCRISSATTIFHSGMKMRPRQKSWTGSCKHTKMPKW